MSYRELMGEFTMEAGNDLLTVFVDLFWADVDAAPEALDGLITELG